MCFTVKYAPPETIIAFNRGDEGDTADPTVDVWALGLICFDLLTLKPYYCPFAKAETVIAQHSSGDLLLSEKPLEPSIAACLGTGAFRDTILSMLSRDAVARLQ